MPQLHRSRFLLHAPSMPRFIVPFRTARTCAVCYRLSFLRARYHFLLGVATRRARARRGTIPLFCSAWHDPIVVLGVATRRARAPPGRNHHGGPAIGARHTRKDSESRAGLAARLGRDVVLLDLIQEAPGCPNRIEPNVVGGSFFASSRRGAAGERVGGLAGERTE